MPEQLNLDFDDGWMSEAEERRAPDPNRGAILPFKKGEDGIELAWPQFMVDTYNAFTLPRDVLSGYNPTVGDTTNFAMGVGLGGVGASAITKPDADLGMFLGAKAKGADKKKLAQAMSMASQQAPREEIWKQTGWWQKPDGQWAFEISDEALDLDPRIWEQLEASHISVLSEEDLSKFDLENRSISRAEEAVKHDELFEAYPTPDVWVGNQQEYHRPFVDIVDLSMGEDVPTSGRFKPNSNNIEAKSSTREGLKGVLTHELQHAVQEREGWVGKGFNTKAAEKLIDDVMAKAPDEYFELDRLTNEHNDLVTSLREYKDSHFEDYADPWDALIHGVDPMYEKTVTRLENKLQDLKSEILKLQANPKVGRFEAALVTFEDNFGRDSYEIYRREEGEVIAEIASQRHDMSSEERAITGPWEHFGTRNDDPVRRREIPRESEVWDENTLRRYLNNLFPEDGIVEERK